MKRITFTCSDATTINMLSLLLPHIHAQTLVVEDIPEKRAPEVPHLEAPPRLPRRKGVRSPRRYPPVSPAKINAQDRRTLVLALVKAHSTVRATDINALARQHGEEPKHLLNTVNTLCQQGVLKKEAIDGGKFMAYSLSDLLVPRDGASAEL